MTMKYIMSSVILALFLSGSVVLAQSGYTLSNGTVHGVSTMTGGTYTLIGVAGQPEGGTASGGQFAVVGGVLSGGDVVNTPIPTATSTPVTPTPTATPIASTSSKIYLPLVKR